MLKLKIQDKELWNESKQEFVVLKGRTLTLEHSLLSVSKWESKWHVPFLHLGDKITKQQFFDYVRCMTVNYSEDFDYLYESLSQDEVNQISAYMDNSCTATWFNEKETTTKKKDIITSEIIYYFMFSLNIPMECEKWNINRLLTLIRVFGEKNKKEEKQTPQNRQAMLDERRRLNEQRRAKMNSKG